MVCPGGPEGRCPDSLLWDRVRERDRLPSRDAALVREAVRDRDRRVMQDEATVETEGEAGSQRGEGKRGWDAWLETRVTDGAGGSMSLIWQMVVNPGISLKGLLPSVPLPPPVPTHPVLMTASDPHTHYSPCLAGST